MYDYRDDVEAGYGEAFERTLARDRDLLRTDPAKLGVKAAKAWEWRYLPAVAAAAQTRIEAGQANDEDRFRMAESLVGLGRYAEALKAFEQPMGDHGNATVYWYRLTEALVAAGRLGDAREAIRQARRIDPNAKEPKRLEARVKRMIVLATELAVRPTWSLAAEFATEAVALQEGAALSAVAEGLMAAHVGAVEEDNSNLAVLARALMRFAPARAQPVIDLVLKTGPDSEVAASVLIERALRGGEAATARTLADKWRGGATQRDLLYVSALATEASGDRARAIQDLGPLSSRFDRDHDIRSALARFVGEDVLARVAPRFAAPRAQTGERRRVINPIPFNNEMTMLDTRLREMADWVDLFVIVEAAQTFTGKPKRCGFDEMKDQFAEWGDKIRHVKIDAFPDHIDSAWARDCWQRDMAIQAVGDFWAPDDIVLLTDSDEIVQRDAVVEFDIGLIALKMKTYRYFFNYEAQPGNPKNDGHTGVVCTADQLGKYGASYIRFTLSRPSKEWNFIRRAGWHFTSMGDAETLVRKFSSYAHQEKNKVKLKDPERMGALLDKIRQGQFEAGWARCDIDENYPAVIRESQEELAGLIL